jgi:PAS domain S-box-containing protein
MNDEEFRQEIGEINQQLTTLQSYMAQLSPDQLEQVTEVMNEIAAALSNLQLINENMQTNLEVSAVVEEELFGQTEQQITQRQHYYDLFQFSPDACVVTDANGLILEANSAIAQLLKAPQSYLIGKPLAVFIAQSDRQLFRSYLNQLSSISDVQTWELSICPQQGEPFVAQLKVAVSYDESGLLQALQIGLRDVSEYKQVVSQSFEQPNQEEILAQVTTSPNPSTLTQNLDGLQVLVVDDEIDAREFITAVLESYGIQVRPVASATEALEALNTFEPDVLISDIRMPEENGYSLIRKLRELEAQKGRHIPSAALTAYLTEDREKALAAGFESHLHKLAEPTELIEMVARLAGRAFEK